MMNRREFACLSVSSALGLAASPLARATSEAPAQMFDYPWKLGIITDEVDANLHQVLVNFYPKYELRWAEIRNVALGGKSTYIYTTATPAQLREIKNQLDAADVKLSVLDTAVYKVPLPGTEPIGMESADLNPNADRYQDQLDQLRRAADAAHALGSDRIRIFAFLRVADPSSIFDRVVDDLQKAVAVAKEKDVTLLLENEFSCNVATGAETAQLFKAISDRRLMHNWDPGNCYIAGEDPFPKAWDKLDQSRIGHIHLKDAEGKSWKPVGGGKIDFAGQFKALKEMKYSGTMSLETHYRNAQNDRYTSSTESMDGLVRVLREV